MKIHPLINPKSKHYMRKGTNLIEDLEKRLTVIEMKGACLFNIYKYNNRNKGQDEEDKIKAQDYTNYLYELNKIPDIDKNLKVCDAFKKNRMEFIYEM